MDNRYRKGVEKVDNRYSKDEEKVLLFTNGEDRWTTGIQKVKKKRTAGIQKM